MNRKDRSGCYALGWSEDPGPSQAGKFPATFFRETLIMPKDIPHAVYGEEKFKMLLVVSF